MASHGRLLAGGTVHYPYAGSAGATALNLAYGWYGLPIVLVIGLVSSLLYVMRPDALFPIFDDSYISLTYARNLIEHGKLTFDGESWSTGATSPLHVVVLAFVMKLGVDPFKASILVGVLSHVALSVGVFGLAWTIFRSQLAGILAALAISFTGLAALDSGNGLETSLFMALIAFTLLTYFLSRRQEKSDLTLLTGVLLALSIFTRPEAGFLIPALVVYRWIDRDPQESMGRIAADAAMLALPGLLAFAMLSGYSLAVSGTLGGTASTKMHFFDEVSQPMRDRIETASNYTGLFAGMVAPLVVLAIVGGNRREALVFAMFWLPVLALYTLLFPGGLLHYFYRYQHPALPMLAVLAGGGAATLILDAMKRDVVVKGLVVAGLLLAIVPMYYQYDRWRDIYTAGSLETHYDLDAMAQELNSIIGPDEVLATHDIGAVGYYADYHVIDLVGLVNPEVVPYHEGRHVDQYVAELQPDYLLIFPSWDRDFLHIDPAANPSKYELVKEYPAGPIRQYPYMLYRVNYTP